MSEPSLNELRADYIALHTRNFDSYMTGRSLTSEQEHYGEQFDAAIAAHDREVKAEAWEEGVSAVVVAHRWNNAEPWAHLQDNPYRIESQETP